jgi:putative tricarboxylic transport membrane protein
VPHARTRTGFQHGLRDDHEPGIVAVPHARARTAPPDGVAHAAVPPARRGLPVTSDRVAAFVIFVVAVLYVREATTFRGATVADVVGPSAYPALVGSLAAVLAAIQFVRPRGGADGQPFWQQHGRPVLLAASLFAYTRALEPLGFVVSTFLYLAGSHLWLGERRPIRAVLLAAALTAVLWAVFDRALGLALPAGVLGR